jgi:hypothetical protein
MKQLSQDYEACDSYNDHADHPDYMDSFVRACRVAGILLFGKRPAIRRKSIKLKLIRINSTFLHFGGLLNHREIWSEHQCSFITAYIETGDAHRGTACSPIKKATVLKERQLLSDRLNYVKSGYPSDCYLQFETLQHVLSLPRPNCARRFLD